MTSESNGSWNDFFTEIGCNRSSLFSFPIIPSIFFLFLLFLVIRSNYYFLCFYSIMYIIQGILQSTRYNCKNVLPKVSGFRYSDILRFKSVFL
jgi:hypothetical protein